MEAHVAAKPKTFDDCLAAAGEDKRAALEKLRKAVRAAAQGAEEGVSYGLAAFRLNGKPLVALGATVTHCAFYLMSNSTVDAHRGELKGYDTSTGTIRFPAGKLLPVALVRKLVKARVAENAGNVAKKRVAKPAASSSPTDPAVVAFLRDLDHPLKKEVEAVRELILAVSPDIREGIKWNSPSFRTTDYFATLNVRGKDRVRLILHTGAKVKASATKGVKVADPAGLLKWLARDRCLVTIDGKKDVEAKRPALQAILKEWIRQV
jgi:uncharacterized protein YdhG (YjbR/CyaY superfamily)